MLRGLPASIIAHAAVLSASYLTFPYWSSSSRTYATDIQAVDVSFAEIGEITNIAPLFETEPEETEEVAPEPEQPEDVNEDPVEEELPEAEQDVSALDAAPPEERPEDVLPSFEPEQQDEPETEPEPQEQPDPTPRRPQDDLLDFLNQSESTFKSERATREARPKPETPKQEPQTALENAPKPAETRNRRGAGERNANTARLEALVVARIRNECWSGVDDLPNPERFNVQMNMKLNKNGTIDELNLIDPKRRPIGSSHMGTAVDRALRAAQKCEPYRLPSEDYEEWREIDFYLGLGFTDK
jgi:outer membrane biosynthesis protein TonB